MAIYGDFMKDDRVLVTDGSPKPPKHHKRKLATWESNNYEGTVWRATDSEVTVYPGEPKERAPSLVCCYQRTNSTITISPR